ncbi:MAG: ATPase, T2SS/T4P/T4SS family [bacterium]
MNASNALEQLLNSINKTYINKFPIDVLKEEMFIPINNEGETIVIGMVNPEEKERRNSILTKIILATRLKPKVLTLNKQQFDDIIKYFEEQINSGQAAQASALSASINPPTKKIGEKLIEEGLITKEQLTQALSDAKKEGIPVGSILVKLGFITIEDLKRTLSKQQGIGHVEEKIDAKAVKLIPEDFIKLNKVVPISTDGKTLVVGMVDPKNKQALNEIIYMTGLKPFPLILTHIEYENYIKTYLETKKDSEKLMEEFTKEDESSLVIEGSENLWQQVEKELQDESSIVAKFASSIITEAIAKKASDVHIEPRLDKYIVRYRIDGILKHIMDIPNKIESLLISRLKVISRMNIAEHRRTQDGRFTIKYGSKVYDLRVNILPVGTKEKMVIRILQPTLEFNANANKNDIQLNGAAKDDIQKINLMTTSPHGIILATGPTGSGKSTTLYSVINKLNSEYVNITTIEDPVEMKMDGVNQVQVNAKADITFASCMRAILRQDPDIIMVGEIRDYETLEAAIHAALTGHLVISTIHTNSATATITRLVEMGAAHHLIASSLMGVIAQRLIRKICPDCKELYEPTDEEIKMISSPIYDDSRFRGNNIYKAVGCDKCSGNGYIGRIGIYEIMPVNREIRKMISQGAAGHEIEEVAISCGMKSLKRAALEAILNGNTTIREYVRVLGASSD